MEATLERTSAEKWTSCVFKKYSRCHSFQRQEKFAQLNEKQMSLSIPYFSCHCEIELESFYSNFEWKIHKHSSPGIISQGNYFADIPRFDD